MKKTRTLYACLVAVLFAIQFTVSAEKLEYPKTPKVDHTDTYFGTTVPDPYRWLEDDNSAETAKWVQEENKLTFGYLEKIPIRMRVKERLEKLYN